MMAFTEQEYDEDLNEEDNSGSPVRARTKSIHESELNCDAIERDVVSIKCADENAQKCPSNRTRASDSISMSRSLKQSEKNALDEVDFVLLFLLLFRFSL